MKSDQRILCVRRDLLAAALEGIPLGFTTNADLLSRFLTAVRAHGEFGARPVLEEDSTFLQIIVQGLVTRGAETLALFRRARTGRADRFVETRHNTKIALCAGGHVEPVEANAGDILSAALLRELTEELVVDPPPAAEAIRHLGLVCNAAQDAPLFHRVHIGIVFHIPVTGSVRLPAGSDEFERVEFCGSERLRELFPRLEGWGQLLAAVLLSGDWFQKSLLESAFHKESRFPGEKDGGQ